VTWDNNTTGVFLEQGRRFDALGNGVGVEFTTGLANTELSPTIAALTDGRFIVGFDNDDSDDGHDDDILATIFDPYGPRTSDFNRTSQRHPVAQRQRHRRHLAHERRPGALYQAFANAPNDWHLIDTGDFNGDTASRPALAQQRRHGGYWHMNGATVISTQAFANAPNDWHIQGVADFNGDAKSDLLWRNNDGTVGTWHMNGATTISTQLRQCAARLAHPGHRRFQRRRPRRHPVAPRQRAGRHLAQ